MEEESQPKKDDKDSLLLLEELSRRLYCPIPLFQEETPDSSLSFCPWKLNDRLVEEEEPKTVHDQQVSNHTTAKAQSQSQEEPATTATATATKTSLSSSSTYYFPSCSYLDLRRHQNVRWATDRFVEGSAHIFLNPPKAESLFQQGLDLVPDHVDLLVAYGKLLTHTKKPLAAISKLQRALEIDPTHKGAKQHLARVQLQQKSLLLRHEYKSKLPPLSLPPKAATAYQDVLMERALEKDSMGLLEDDIAEDDNDDQNNKNDSIENRKSSSRKHKKHKKRRRKRHRRRRRHDSSSSEEESSSSSDSSPSGEEEEDDDSDHEDSRRRKRKRRRKHRSVSSPSSSTGSEEDEDEDSRKQSRRKRKHHRKRHKKKHSKRKRKRREPKIEEEKAHRAGEEENCRAVEEIEEEARRAVEEESCRAVEETVVG